MGKIFGGLLWSFAFVVYFVWVFMSTDGSERMTRACMPISWVGNVTTSLTSVIVPGWEDESDSLFKKGTYTCEFALWRLFYEKEYLELQKQDGDADDGDLLNDGNDEVIRSNELTREQTD